MEDGQDAISPQMRAMKWEWTPELLELRQRGWDTKCNYHANLGLNLNEDLDYKYSASLPLPAYDDKRGMMRVCGLADSRIDTLLEDRLVDLFTHRDEGDPFDYEESYEGYIKKSVQQGLRPEFAIWCGLHDDDPGEKAKQFSTFTPPQPNWDKNSPMYYVDEIFMSNQARLEMLWCEKLKADGIVIETEHGDVLVDDQATAG